MGALGGVDPVGRPYIAYFPLKYCGYFADRYKKT